MKNRGKYKHVESVINRSDLTIYRRVTVPQYSFVALFTFSMCHNVLIVQDDVDCWRGNFVVRAHYYARMFATNALTVPLSDLTQTCQIRCTCDILQIALVVYTREICTLNLDRYRKEPR